MTWSTITDLRHGLIEVIPNDDIKEHRLSPLCECRPTKELQYRGPDVIAAMFTHNAYDGRP